MHRNVRRFGAAYLEAAAGASQAELPALAKRLVAALARRRQRKLLPKILAALPQLWNERHGLTPMRLITASKFDVAALQRTLGDVELTTKVDPSIIGGAIVDRGDTRYDGSVRAALNRLHTALARKD